MAYIIYTNENKLVGIADNDADRDSYNGIENLQAVSVSDSNYDKVKNNEVIIGDYDSANSQHNLQERETELIPVIEGVDQLNQHVSDLKERLNSFLEVPENESKTMWTRCNDYHSYLESLDTSSLTYPINSTWERYCSDNSISYVNTLQIG